MPSPSAAVTPARTSVPLPSYRAARRAKPESGPSLVSVVLLVAAPAIFAAAILRPRSR
ncbi:MULTISPECIES: hypothetical protein [unclassified Streptomyces]|uniref:hypothetical protein n=1 Tax=unclassified Streptomyces TaxID=2593676 RepID=UPI0015A58AA3|nr:MULTISPECIES: hypothetical protein [unclassified Streptomyces]